MLNRNDKMLAYYVRNRDVAVAELKYAILLDNKPLIQRYTNRRDAANLKIRELHTGRPVIQDDAGVSESETV